MKLGEGFSSKHNVYKLSNTPKTLSTFLTSNESSNSFLIPQRSSSLKKNRFSLCNITPGQQIQLDPLVFRFPNPSRALPLTAVCEKGAEVQQAINNHQRPLTTFTLLETDNFLSSPSIKRIASRPSTLSTPFASTSITRAPTQSRTRPSSPQRQSQTSQTTTTATKFVGRPQHLDTAFLQEIQQLVCSKRSRFNTPNRENLLEFNKQSHEQITKQSESMNIYSFAPLFPSTERLTLCQNLINTRRQQQLKKDQSPSKKESSFHKRLISNEQDHQMNKRRFSEYLESLPKNPVLQVAISAKRETSETMLQHSPSQAITTMQSLTYIPIASPFLESQLRMRAVRNSTGDSINSYQKFIQMKDPADEQSIVFTSKEIGNNNTYQIKMSTLQGGSECAKSVISRDNEMKIFQQISFNEEDSNCEPQTTRITTDGERKRSCVSPKKKSISVDQPRQVKLSVHSIHGTVTKNDFARQLTQSFARKRSGYGSFQQDFSSPFQLQESIVTGMIRTTVQRLTGCVSQMNQLPKINSVKSYNLLHDLWIKHIELRDIYLNKETKSIMELQEGVAAEQVIKIFTHKRLLELYESSFEKKKVVYEKSEVDYEELIESFLLKDFNIFIIIIEEYVLKAQQSRLTQVVQQIITQNETISKLESSLKYQLIQKNHSMTPQTKKFKQEYRDIVKPIIDRGHYFQDKDQIFLASHSDRLAAAEKKLGNFELIGLNQKCMGGFISKLHDNIKRSKIKNTISSSDQFDSHQLAAIKSKTQKNSNADRFKNSAPIISFQ